ncbi:ABC transporter-related protein [Chloroherpeton thalassium ATCC 35110]|uniref:ABC transporter-related protein n=1 Tax=Chloroherpeton thalassium (strain ATCC 35110 / GB-78) TaxID=517418 RepID=B3QU98_CHLT3|nr:ATP-binding cassette domain-containing protein [Chloroherpeton thalassium]ACF14347.1 ABC transporter-related protein [Chloroherpeton thalassium ATCC 35110]
MKKIIELRNVTAFRGEKEIYRNLSLEVVSGCNTAILGPNGAGKTTLLKLLSREIYPKQTKESFIRVFGKERWNIWELRSHFGMISHDLQHRYIESATGLNVILSGLYSSIDTWQHQHFEPADIEKAMKIMEDLAICPLRERCFAEMSTGEQRRFLLGRALINEPDALLLDEPTSGLDIKAAFQYLEIIRRLMQTGRTVILVTHHIHEIPPEISRVILLKNGQILDDGEKGATLTSEKLSHLFEVPVHVAKAHGYFQVLPAGSSAG